MNLTTTFLKNELKLYVYLNYLMYSLWILSFRNVFV